VRSRSLTIAALGGLLVAMAALSPASAQPTSRPSAGARGHGPQPSGTAFFHAAGRWILANSAADPALAGNAAISAAARAAVARARRGILTGIVRRPDGRPLRGACVTATGPDGSTFAVSRADGRYLLPNLPAGQYSLRVRDCARPASSGSVLSNAAWPGLPARVTLLAGQIRTLPSVTMTVGDSALSAATKVRPAVTASSQGSIAGKVTGHGHALAGICAQALRVGGGQGRDAVTTKSGRYRITPLPVGRYYVEFAANQLCGNKLNWLDQWYPHLTSPFQPPQAAKVVVKAGKTTTGIDGSLELGGELAGTVRTKSGRALKGICIQVNGRIHGGYESFELRSPRSGKYVLNSLFPGTYSVEFSTGCGNRGNFAPQYWRDKAHAAHQTPIKISTGQIVTGVNAALTAGASVEGVVRATNSAGKPLAGICVLAAGSAGLDFAGALTHANGSYRLDGLADGKYQIQFDPSCQGQTSSNYLGQQRQVQLKAAQSLTGIDGYLTLGAGLSGTVRNSRGQLVDGACVQAFDSEGGGFFTQTSDGVYSLHGLIPGTYTEEFFGGCGNLGSLSPQYYNDEGDSGSADPIVLNAGATTPGIDATMQPGATISGVVTGPGGKRLTGVCVGVASAQLLGFGGDDFDVIEFTDNGRYTAANLGQGQYGVNFGCGTGPYVTHWYGPDSGGSAPAALLSVPSGVKITGIDARMQRGGAIAGLVTNSAGHRVQTVCVVAFFAGSGKEVLTGNGGYTFGSDGQYDVTGLAPGRYDLQISDCSGKTRYAGQWYRDKLTRRRANPVVVRAGRTTSGINAVLSVGGSIAGLVTTTSGKPLRGICAYAYDPATKLARVAETGKTGRYLVTGLATGRYSMMFFPCSTQNSSYAQVTRAKLVPVKAPHAVTGVNARLRGVATAGSGSVSGTVVGGSPTPKPQIGTCVEIIPVKASGSYRFATTNGTGAYRATGLAAGAYQVYFNDPGCFLDPFLGGGQFGGQWFDAQPTQATAKKITVAAGQTVSSVDATLEPNSEITGTVTGPSDAPLAGECVIASPVGPDFAGALSPELAVTGQDGTYALVDMQPGQYTIEVTSECGATGYATRWYKHAARRTGATEVIVGLGGTASGIDVTVPHK
jgi:Carboxypeptidase regulatory-like domain